jgi:hypothetical protein
VQFVAVILTALTFAPSGAHLFELPNKIGLSEEHYFIVQSIYRGWAFFGIVIVAGIGTNLTLAVMLMRRESRFGRASQPLLFSPHLGRVFCVDLPGQSGLPTTGQ